MFGIKVLEGLNDLGSRLEPALVGLIDLRVALGLSESPDAVGIVEEGFALYDLLFGLEPPGLDLLELSACLLGLDNDLFDQRDELRQPLPRTSTDNAQRNAVAVNRQALRHPLGDDRFAGRGADRIDVAEAVSHEGLGVLLTAPVRCSASPSGSGGRASRDTQCYCSSADLVAMELRHLRYFVAVVDELHFGRAACRLHIVQPALSKSIMALEQELGVQLLVRTKRSVSVTDAGELLAREARVILQRVDRAVDSVRLTGSGHLGRLEIGCIAPATWSILPQILRDYRLRYPEVKVRLTELPSAEQLTALEEGAIDVGFVRLPLNDDALEFDVVYREPFIATVPETHPLAHEPTISVAALAEEPFIAATRSAEPGFYDQCLAVFAEHGCAPKIVEEANAASAMLGMVAMGLGVTVSPMSLRTMPRAGVTCRPLTASTIVLDLGVARQVNARSATLATFLQAVRETAAVTAPADETREPKAAAT